MVFDNNERVCFSKIAYRGTRGFTRTSHGRREELTQYRSFRSDRVAHRHSTRYKGHKQGACSDRCQSSHGRAPPAEILDKVRLGV